MKWLLIVLLLVCCVLSPLLFSRAAEAQAGNQWQILYYANPNWSGAPAYTQYVSVLNLNWNGAAPGPNVPAQNFSATMSTDMYFYAGLYVFTLTADDEISLAVGSQTYFSSMGTNQSGKTFTVNVPITLEGMNHITIYYRQDSGPSYINVSMAYQKGGNSSNTPAPTPAPPNNNTPAPSQDLVTEFGDFTPCIQKNLHQSQCFKADGVWNSPNLGSIQMEPKIALWGACKADTVQPEVLNPTQGKVSAKCSKTDAGWFAN